LSQVFRDVHLDYISTYWRAGAAPAALAALYFAYAQKAGFRWADLSGCIEADPLHFLVCDGVMPHNLESAFDEMASLLHFVREHSPSMQVIAVQGHAYHNGGASSAQEMAYVLATAVFYLREMVCRGFKASQVVPHMRLCFSIGSQHFVEIAKLRAVRLLWNRILEAFEVAPEDRKLHLHARTGLWNKTVYDPYVNMLRTTNEAFAAIVGGCDSLHVSPFDEIIRETDAFSRRIARNTHAILGGECYLSRVIDPAGGSYAVESLTSQLADKAWIYFQEVESSGGMVAALKSGKVQNSVEEIRAQKAANIQKRRDSIVGSNLYPLRGEKKLPERRTDYAMVARQQKARARRLRQHSQQDGELAAVRAVELPSAEKMTSAVFAAVAGATLGEIHRAFHIRSCDEFKIAPIPMRRASQDFEVLRQRSQKAAIAGKAPQILQLNIGPSRNYRMRADWTSAFFETGGFDVLNENDFTDAAAALEACKSGKAQVAVITSDDATYAAQVEGLAKSIKAECPHIHLLVAGAPGENEALWRAAGVDDFVNVKVNNYTMNKALLDRLKA
jgi:methylmalonyl-CoA mutase